MEEGVDFLVLGEKTCQDEVLMTGMGLLVGNALLGTL